MEIPAPHGNGRSPLAERVAGTRVMAAHHDADACRPHPHRTSAHGETGPGGIFPPRYTQRPCDASTMRLWMAEQSAEPEVFRHWARSFQQECTRHRWIARCELTEAVTYALRFGAMTPPKEIGWLGFDRPTPAERGATGSPHSAWNRAADVGLENGTTCAARALCCKK